MNGEAEHPDWRSQLEALERKNRLLAEGIKQAERLRQLWGDAVQELKHARAELKASREFLEQVLTVSPDPLLVVDRHGRILLANLAASRLMESPREKLIGRQVLRLLDARERRRILALFRGNLGSGKTEVMVRTRQGKRLVVAEWSLVRHAGHASDIEIVLAGCDITEQRRNERLLELENSLLATVSSSTSLPAILETLCLGIESILPGALCSILLLDDTGQLRLGASPSLPDHYNQAVDGFSPGPTAGSCGTAAYRKQTVIVADIAQDPLWRDYRMLAGTHGLAACWSVPILTSADTLLGTFAIYHRAPHVPAPHELQIATRAAHLASLAIQRKRAEEALSKSEAQLKEITATLGEGVYVLDTDGRIVFANPEMEKLLGWSIAELIGREAHAMFHDMRPDGGRIHPSACCVNASLHTGQTLHADDDWLVRKDGSWIPVALVSSPILRNGEIMGAVVAVQDIRERKQAQEALRRAAHYARSLLEASLDPLVVISPEGKITDVNKASEEVTGVPREELIGTDFADYFTEPERAQAGYRRVLEQGYVRDYALTIRHHSGRRTDVLYNATVFRGESGELRGVFAAARDITDRKKTEQKIHHLAYYDILTNLPNRRLLLDRLHHAIALAKRHQRTLAVLFLDLDFFKQINDTLGHDAGDGLLKEFARRLRGCVRRADTVSRQGGDEFVIVLTEIIRERDAATVAEKILRALAQPILIKGNELHITTSIGIAVYPRNSDEDAHALIKYADTAMYAAKQAGRNCYRFYPLDP